MKRAIAFCCLISAAIMIWAPCSLAGQARAAPLTPLKKLTLPNGDSIAKLRLASAFAFRARVDSLRASTVPEVPASPNTIAVTPLSTLQCPYAVGVYDHAPVTIYVKDLTDLAPQQEYWFFAAGWVIGSRLAVREIMRVPGAYADSTLKRQFLGPTGPAAAIKAHLRDTVYVVTGTLLLDSLRPLRGEEPTQDNTNVTRRLRIRNSLSTPFGWPIDSLVPVVVPVNGILHWPLLQMPDAYQHHLFFVHTTMGQPGDIVANGPKPPYMLRDVDDIWPIMDSAFVAREIAKQKNRLLGAPSPDFVRRCGSKAK